MQIMRKTWIDEGKLDRANHNLDSPTTVAVDKGGNGSSYNTMQAATGLVQADAETETLESSASKIGLDKHNHNEDSDLFFSFPKDPGDKNTDVPDDDELDGLLAERDNDNRNDDPSIAVQFAESNSSTLNDF